MSFFLARIVDSSPWSNGREDVNKSAISQTQVVVQPCCGFVLFVCWFVLPVSMVYSVVWCFVVHSTMFTKSCDYAMARTLLLQHRTQ